MKKTLVCLTQIIQQFVGYVEELWDICVVYVGDPPRKCWQGQYKNGCWDFMSSFWTIFKATLVDSRV